MSREDLFGKWITINRKLSRLVTTPTRLDRERGVFQVKRWEPFKIAPRKVLVIGRRTLQNGETRLVDGGDSIAWYRQGAGVPAYLVVETSGFAPFYVPRDAVVEVINK